MPRSLFTNLNTSYFKKGIAFKYKLSYSKYIGFADQL